MEWNERDEMESKMLVLFAKLQSQRKKQTYLTQIQGYTLAHPTTATIHSTIKLVVLSCIAHASTYIPP